MKFSDQQLLEEAYFNVKNLQTDRRLQLLLAEDLKLIDQLIEEGFGDYIKKVGSSIKGGFQKVASKIKETLTNGLANTLVKTIISAIPKQELENLVNIVAKGQVPKDKAEEVKNILVQTPVASKDSVQEKKAWLASLLFTESNIELALKNSGILSEAESGRELQKFAKEVANKINTLYPKNKKAMAAAIPKFSDTVSRYLGLPPQTPNTPQTLPATDTNPPTEISTTDQSSSTPDNNSSQTSQQTTDSSQTSSSAPTGKGIVNKIVGFIKKHPKISAAAGATLLGIVVAAFAGAAPVVVPALITALKGAGIGGTTSIVRQLISGEKVDLKRVGKAAVIGGVIGGVGGVLVQGLGNIASQFTPQEVVALNREIVNNQTVTDKIAAGKRLPLFGANYDYGVAANDEVANKFSSGHSGFRAADKLVK